VLHSLAEPESRHQFIGSARATKTQLTNLKSGRPKLVWLDQAQRPVPKRAAELNESEPREGEASFVEELVQSDPEQPKLATSSLVWSLTVKRSHANQVFTCLANHQVYENEQLFPSLYKRQPRRRVMLDVLYEPVIDLIKDQLYTYENRPVRFTCQAHARPNQLTYRWFIDEQPVKNVSGPELYIGRLTRQLHLREIKCKVSNAIGASSAVLRLLVRYAPAFVGHLLAGGHQAVGPRQQQQQQQQAAELALSQQLALGFEQGQDVQLRCDFDSNPRVQSVLWFKFNTEYSIMSDVKPARANTLIAYGALRAIFAARLHEEEEEAEAAAASATAEPHWPKQQQQQQRAAQMGAERRQLASNGGESSQTAASGGQQVQAQVQPEEELDYGQMSLELLEELAAYESQLKENSSQSDSSQVHSIEPIASQSATPSSVRIREPLDWLVRASSASELAAGKQEEQPAAPTGQQKQKQQQQQQGEEANGNSNSNSNNTLSLLQPRNPSSSGQTKLLRREAQLASSFIQLTNANEDSIGKYVCKAKPVDGAPAAARAIFLVMRQRPRIISSAHQPAPLSLRHVQLECLAQINTVLDNSIVWSKDGKVSPWPNQTRVPQTQSSNRTPKTQRPSSWLGARRPMGALTRSPSARPTWSSCAALSTFNALDWTTLANTTAPSATRSAPIQ